MPVLNKTLSLFLLCLLATSSVAAPKTTPDDLWLRSHAALIVDQRSGDVLFEKHADEQLPIASITKLMTAMVTLDAGLDMTQVIKITRDDKDTLRNSRSRLPFGSLLSREDLLKMALIASENRAASALARTWPQGQQDFIKRMNGKARELGMVHTRFVESTGLSERNRSTARDLGLLLQAAWQYEQIRDYSSQGKDSVTVWRKAKQKELEFFSTNRLLRRPNWQIGLSKTGYIREAGRCLVMQTTIKGRDLLVVLLNSQGKLSPFGDSGRIRRWLEAREKTRQAGLKGPYLVENTSNGH